MTPPPRLRRRLVLGSTVLAVATGCDPVVAPRTTVWSAELSGTGGQLMLSGSAAAVSDERARWTEVGIRIQGGPPASTLAWRVRTGPCGSAAPVLGAPVAYTPLETDEVGGDEREARVSQPMVHGGRYSIEVAIGSDPEDVIACAEFEQR